MYLDLLRPGNTTFVDSIGRGILHHRSSDLNNVITAVQQAQLNLTAANLATLITSLHKWRQKHTIEYKSRGTKNGVAYRLWMETKQLIRNQFHQNIAYPTSTKPVNSPGDVLLNIFVPPSPDGNMEICHGFAYRWAVASGKMAEHAAQPAMGGNWSGAHVAPYLYPGFPANNHPARVGGLMQTQPGDIISMWTPAVIQHGVVVAPRALGHSLIAETPTNWYSANNAGTFGLGVSRSYADTAHNFGVFGLHQVGWVGGTNQWRRPDGVDVDVFYLRL
jgi:hypothetical protein